MVGTRNTNFGDLMPDSLQDLLSDLNAGRPEATARHLGALAETAVTDLPTFQQTIDLLAYHNQPRLLADLVRIVWPVLQTTRDPALLKLRNELVTRATDSLIFAHLAGQGYDTLPVEPSADLIATLQAYFPIDAAGLARYLAVLSGLEQANWQLSDFDLRGSAGETAVDPATAAENLTTLLVEFLAYAHQSGQMAYSRANLAAPELRVYFSMRRIGQLAPRDSVADLMRGGPRPLPDARFGKEPHPLVPDRTTFENYVSRLLHFANPQPYRAAAVFEAVPVWLRFLTGRNLVDAAGMQTALGDVGGMRDRLADFWEEQVPDPALQRGLENWR